MLTYVKNALRAVVAFTLLLGLLYPLAVTGVAQVAMPGRANGSLIERDGAVVGSRLIAQDFRRPLLDATGEPERDADGEPRREADLRYFQPRPSQTGYAADATAFSNLGPNATATRDAIRARIDEYLGRERRHLPTLTVDRIPVDAVMTSASGVDPLISVANARIQAHRIVAVRGLSPAVLRRLIDDHTRGRQLGVLGEPGVEVLPLNLALDGLDDGATDGDAANGGAR